MKKIIGRAVLTIMVIAMFVGVAYEAYDFGRYTMLMDIEGARIAELTAERDAKKLAYDLQQKVTQVDLAKIVEEN